MDDYSRIARVIRYLDENATRQPDLDELAGVAKLSRFHFHRLFSAWAGATPKDFLQCLTLENARVALREGSSVLDAAVDVGLSGPGRLHDLCVTLEAASPGEIKSGGAGIDIVCGVAASPFGECVVASTPRGVCHLSFVEDGSRASAIAALRAEWPAARLSRDDRTAENLLRSIFTTDTGARPRHLRAFVKATAFKLRVWRALVDVPFGCLVSYGRLAAAAGSPAAARAVGSAVAANPVAFLIPCHRVIRETGVVGRYRWGAARKRQLIAWETAKARTGVS